MAAEDQIDKKLAVAILLATEDQRISRTALNKILFFADAGSILSGKGRIAESGYIKLDYGPVPDGIDETRSWLVKNGLLSEEIGMAGPYIQHSYKSAISEEDKRKISESLNAEHRTFISKAVSALGRMSAKDLSDISHKFEPWKSGEWYKKLNFDLALNDDGLRCFLKERDIIN